MTKADQTSTASSVTSARRTADLATTNRRAMLAVPPLLGLAAVPVATTVASVATTSPDPKLLAACRIYPALCQASKVEEEDEGPARRA